MKLGLSHYVVVCFLAGGFGFARNASAQQQFGPSPQAMYKQHPGSAPTYTNYGAPGLTTKISSPNTLTSQHGSTPRTTASRTISHSTRTTAVRRKLGPKAGSTGR